MNEQQTEKTFRLGKWFRLGALLLALVLVWQILAPSILNTISGSGNSTAPPADTPQGYLELANQAITDGNYDGALSYLEEGRRLISPEGDTLLPELWLTTASVCILKGDWTAAWLALDRSLEADPGYGDALLLRGQLAIEAEDYPAAITDVLAYLEGKPGDTETRRTLAQLMEMDADYDAAAQQYELLYSGDQEDESFRLNALRCLFLSGRYDEAIEGFDDYILRLGAGEDPFGGIADFLRAACLTQKEEYAAAAEGFEKAASRGYDRAACLEQIIYCRFEEGSYEAVLTAGRELETVDTTAVTTPAQTWQRVGIAGVYLAGGQTDFEEALASLERAQTIEPTLTGNDYYRGICLLSLNRPEEAVTAFTGSLEEGFLPQYCYYNRGVCYVNMQAYEFAREDMEMTLDCGEDEELWNAAEEILSQLAEYSEPTDRE